MAGRKESSTTVSAKAASAQVVNVGARLPRTALQPRAGQDSRQLMREAAWSRMFGRVESKNPFTR